MIRPLTWTTLIISIAVIVVIGVILWIAVSRAQARGGAEATRSIPIQEGARGTNWISTGVAISAVPLLLTLVWTMVALAKISSGPAECHRAGCDTASMVVGRAVRIPPIRHRIFSTANEIHIPVGMPVKVRLHGADVIHSFWVPKLSGKADAIPGRTNVTWLQASAPGRLSRPVHASSAASSTRT